MRDSTMSTEGLKNFRFPLEDLFRSYQANITSNNAAGLLKGQIFV